MTKHTQECVHNILGSKNMCNNIL